MAAQRHFVMSYGKFHLLAIHRFNRASLDLGSDMSLDLV